jgi:hypothetical protein
MARWLLHQALTSGIKEHDEVTIMTCFSGVALYWVVKMNNEPFAIHEDKLQRVAELYGLIMLFPPFNKSLARQKIFGKEISEAVKELPSKKAEEAIAKGREMDVWVVAESLLKELTDLGWGET